eukprot:3799234-Prorocentrum_lima.AAC.1
MEVQSLQLLELHVAQHVQEHRLPGTPRPEPSAVDQALLGDGIPYADTAVASATAEGEGEGTGHGQGEDEAGAG